MADTAHGGGLYSGAAADAGPLIRNCIFANNGGVTGMLGPDLYGNVQSRDYNLIGRSEGYTMTGAAGNNLTDVDPRLENLADYGGSTETHALLSDSPAIDVGICTDTSGDPVNSDQRGVARPQGSGCDIGAYELSANTSEPTELTLQADPASLTVGSASTLTATVVDELGSPVPDGTEVVFETDLGDLDGLGSQMVTKSTTAGTAAATLYSELAGTAHITASAGSAVQDSGNVTFNVGALQQIEVSPSSVTLAPQQTQQFTAEGYDAYGNEVAISPTWSVANSDAGSIGSGTGLFTAGTLAGSYPAVVEAAAGGESGTADVSVTAGALDRIEVSPSSVSLTPEQTQQFTAEGYDAYGNEVVISPTWSVANSDAGSIGSGTGLFTAGTLAGSYPAVVEAAAGGETGTADVTVTAGALSQIEVTPGSVTLAPEATQQFTAAGYDAYGNELDIVPSWSMVNGAAGSVDSATGLFTAGTTPGDYPGAVRAGAGGETGTADVTVTTDCTPPDILSITSDSPAELGEAINLSATVDGSTPLTYTWDFHGALGEGTNTDTATPTFIYTQPGTYTVGLEVLNSCGDDQDQTTVQVMPPEPDSLTLVPSRFAQAVGDVITLVATLLDEMGQPLAGTDVTFQVSPIGFFQGNGLQTIVTPTDGSGDAEAGLTSNETGTTTVIAETGSGLTDTLEVEFYEPVVIEGVDANTPVEVGDTAVFTASVGGTGPLTYTWSFGGEGRATGEDTATPTYLYDAPGTYPVVLTVESPFNTDQFERLVEVTRRQPASLVLEASTAAQAIDGAVELVATLFDKLGQPLAEDYDVTFTVSPIGYFVGEGQTATVLTDGSGEADATLTSAEIGTAIVTAETGDGQISDSVEVPFYEPVRITALEANSPVSFGDALHFVATVEGSGELEYAWDFGGDAQVSGQDTATPSVVYDRPGAYTVGLTVTGPYDGDTATTDVRVTGTEIHVPLIVASATP